MMSWPGLVPAISIQKAMPCPLSEIAAGTSPAMTHSLYFATLRSVAGLALDHGLELAVFLARRVAADQLHLLQVVERFQAVALLHLPHAVIGPGAHVVGIGGERLLVPDFRVFILAELAVGVADVIGDIGMLVVADGVHGGDAALIVADENHFARGAIVAQKLCGGLRGGGLLDHAGFLFLLLAAVVGRDRWVVGAHGVEWLHADCADEQGGGGENADRAERAGRGHDDLSSGEFGFATGYAGNSRLREKQPATKLI